MTSSYSDFCSAREGLRDIYPSKCKGLSSLTFLKILFFFFPKNFCHGNNHISFSYFNINLKSLYLLRHLSCIYDFSDYLFPFIPFFLEHFLFHNINLESFCILKNVELFSQSRCNFSSQKIISPSSMPFLLILGKYNIFLFTIRTWQACTRPGVSSFATPGTVIRHRGRKCRWWELTFRFAEKSPIDSRSCCWRSQSLIVPRSLRRCKMNLLAMISAHNSVFAQWSTTKIAGSIPCAVSAQTERPLSSLTLPYIRRHKRVRAGVYATRAQHLVPVHTRWH